MGSSPYNQTVSELSSADSLEVVKLRPLMELTSGSPEIAIGLIDGPVLIDHADLASESISEVPNNISGACAKASSAACKHGTFVAGILSAKRSSSAPAICPDCTLLVRPIFSEALSGHGQMPSATPQELSEAVIQCIEAGARVINLSAALAQPSSRTEPELQESLDYAARRSVIVIAAVGNQGAIGSSAITRHRWVIPVVACDLSATQIWETPSGGEV
jgi:subtilisin family serine protease